MSDDDMVDPRVREVFAAAISADVAAALTVDDSTETVVDWDSTSFVGVIVGIEQAFGVRFSTLEAARMNSVRGIQEILSEKGVELRS
jgi:acyl carrier protein